MAKREARSLGAFPIPRAAMKSTTNRSPHKRKRSEGPQAAAPVLARTGLSPISSRPGHMRMSGLRRTRCTPRASQRGFALLTIVFLAAVIAVGLAASLPRIAMQAQRVREERLIYRGEQYRRAIELYFREHKKYPADLDDLEDTNDVRYLRRRYKDPITGDDEWRIIHMGPDGRFKDSLIYDLEDPDNRAGSGSSSFGGGGAFRGSSQARAPVPAANPAYAGNYVMPGFQVPDGRFRGADRARAVRESAAPAIPGQTSAIAGGGPRFDEAGNPIVPQKVSEGGESGEDAESSQPQAGQFPGYSRMLPSQVQQASRQARQQQPAAGLGIFGQNRGNQSNSSQGGFGSAGAAAGRGGSSAFGAQAGRPPSQFGGQGNFASPGAGGQAANVIRNLLTSPRPGGLAGIRAGQTRSQTGGASFTGGIAGVATKAEEFGVKVYQQREMYNEWEFVYDYRGVGAGAQQPPGPGGPPQPVAQGQPGLSPFGGLSVTPGAGGLPTALPVASPKRTVEKKKLKTREERQQERRDRLRRRAEQRRRRAGATAAASGRNSGPGAIINPPGTRTGTSSPTAGGGSQGAGTSSGSATQPKPPAPPPLPKLPGFTYPGSSSTRRR